MESKKLTRAPAPPGPRGGAPIRALLGFRRDPIALIERMKARHGDVVGWRVGTFRFYLVAHPELAREVLVVRGREFTKSRALKRARVLLGNGLLTSEGDFHLRQRRLAQPAFHRERIAALAGDMVAISARAADGWKAGETLDVGREMNRMTLAIAGETLFGARVEGEADEIGGALTDALGLFGRLSNPIGPLLDHIPVPGTIRFHRAR
ncbi:MAG TPA: cytochrome P450, partial [Longimicrobium sp.]